MCVLASRVAVRLPGVCSRLQGLRESRRGVRRGLPGCQDQARNTPRIYLHLIPIERSGPSSCENSSLVWTKTPAIHLLLRSNVLKEAPREPKNMCVEGTVCLCLCIFIIKGLSHMCVHMHIVRRHDCTFQRQRKQDLTNRSRQFKLLS